MKNYPFEVHTLVETGTYGPTTGYYSKGHQDRAEFLSEIKHWDDKLQDATLDDVAHEWWRSVPSPDGEGIMVVHATGPGKGAFPVTHIEVPL